METIVGICAIACVCLYVIFSMMIVHQLSKRGVKISFLLLRLYIIKYLHQYKKITLEETGKVGPLFYPCIISINMALVFTLLYFIL